MRKRTNLVDLGMVLLTLLASGVGAEENFPRPEFTHGQTFPQVTKPMPRAGVFSYVDALVLLGTLSLAAYLTLRRRSRGNLVWLAVFSLGYFGFWRHGCICSVGSVQNIAYALGQNGYAVPLVVGAFFVLPLLFALFAGRVFCSGVCPLGALQEIVLLRPMKVPPWLDSALSVLPFLYLGTALLYAVTGSAFLICKYDPFVLFFRFGGSLLMLGIGIGLLLLSVFVGRPYCRYLCPYSVLLRWLAPLALWRTKITTHECINCHLCANSCPYGAIKPPTPVGEKFDRRAGRRSLVLQLLLLPVLVAGGAGLLHLGSPALGQMDAKIRLAERLYLEEKGLVQGTTPETEAFANLEVLNAVAYQAAVVQQKRIDIGSWLLGGWIGLIFGLKLIGMSLRRRRLTYSIDPAACVGCGRCYSVCPLDRDVEVVTGGAPAGRADQGTGAKGGVA